jgi:glutaminyl-peptide cyclotransferase
MQFHRVHVVRRMPHPGNGFTQGLIAEWGGQDVSSVWESTGQYGQSTLRRYEAGASVPAAQAELAAEFFGEGICRVADGIWQLTWRERIALRWDAATLEMLEQVRYNRQGWGMCAVGGALSPPEVITSDGTSELVRRDPVTLEPREVVQVRCQGQRVLGLNDLTWAGGLVWANVAGTDALAGIDLASGEITDVVDARAAAERHWGDPNAIMNGIAALATPGEFLLTGKGWKSIRQVRLAPDRDRGHIDRLLSGFARLTIMLRAKLVRFAMPFCRE